MDPASFLLKTSKSDQIRDIVGAFDFDKGKINYVMEVLESEMKLGLSKNEADRKRSSLQMENTYVRETLNGTEHGDFLALDLGGTNFRVLYVSLRDGKMPNHEDFPCESFEIPQYILHGTATTLFDYLAESIYRFIRKYKIEASGKIPLGFTFSFPMVQKKLNSGFLVTWTKSFKCQGGVMEDAVVLLEEAIDRRGDIDVHVVAILNDATGTLMAGAYYDHRVEIGLIMGTGSNACYMEHIDRMDKWEGDANKPKQVIVDIEWGAFGDNGVLSGIKTKYDRLVDLKSNHTGSFTFEKLFSGLYMGELVRLVLAELCTEKLIFNGQGSEKLFTFMEFPTKFISKVLSDIQGKLTNTRNVISLMDLEDVASEEDMGVLQYVCAAVSARAANLVSACLAVLVKHVDKPDVAIAVDGSLFKLHPTLRPMMEGTLESLCPGTKTSFVLADDGSGKGAAFVAAVAVRMEQEGLINSQIMHTDHLDKITSSDNMAYGNSLNGHSIENISNTESIPGSSSKLKTAAAAAKSKVLIPDEPLMNGRHAVRSS